MNKYERKTIINETIPKFINDFELNLLLLETKAILAKTYDKKIKEVSNNTCLMMLLNKFYKFPKEEQEFFYKHIISKINKNSLYVFFLMHTCDYLIEKDYDNLDNMLKSFVSTGLVKSAVLADDKKFIKITLTDNKEIKYSHIPLKKELVDAYSGQCHFVTSVFLKKCKRISGAAVVLEDHEIFGKYYHSFLLVDDIMHDLAHNIVMKYKDYIKLINPTILISEDKNTILNNIKELESSSQTFVDSDYVDILKYAINKKMKKGT